MLASRVLPAAALLLLGCGGTTLHVESDTEWSGTVSDLGPVSGRGNARYELSHDGGSCWQFAKRTEAGTLRAYAEQSTWFGLGSDVQSELTTTAPGGSVQGCTQ